MNLSKVFIERPIATALLMLGIALAGALSFFLLPVAPLPQVEFPTLQVEARLPGASPDTMAATVATPLERSLGNIAGVTEITSQSSLGQTRITLQFQLERDIEGAARDVQAAINASRSLLPAALPGNPSYRKSNPADAPILVVALTSDTLSRGQLYDAASTLLAQRLSQVEGIGQVDIGGGALPAVRIDLDPHKLAAQGLSLEQVRKQVEASNAQRPKGQVEDGQRQWQIGANDQAPRAADYAPLIINWRQGAAVRLQDVAEVSDGVQDSRTYGLANGKPSVILMLKKAPGANVVESIDRVHALLPKLRAAIPAAIQMDVVLDRAPSIRAGLREVEKALLIALALVIMVVYAGLRSVRAALVPAVVVPVSMAGTFGVMYLLGYSVDNLSMMAMTVATGFLVDDAIVVVENITRHMQRGKSAWQAALDGGREIGFTLVSIGLALVAAFIPILFMGGIVGRLFREFAVVLCSAILISTLISLSATPMLAAQWLRPTAALKRPGRWARLPQRLYRKSLAWSLRHQPVLLALLLGVIALNVALYGAIPKGFFPQQDTGRINGNILADQSTSFQAMQQRMVTFVETLRRDPAVANVTAFTGGRTRNSAGLNIALKPLSERGESADQVVNRLRAKLAHEPGATLFMGAERDLRIGGRPGNAQFEYTLQADEPQTLREWEPRVRQMLQRLPELADVSSDQQDRGLQTTLDIDRDAAARLGVPIRNISSTLNDAYGQRLVGVIYNPQNQYRVVLGLAPAHLQNAQALGQLLIPSNSGEGVPLASLASIRTTLAPLVVNHQSGTPATTLTFNLAEGVALSQASAALDEGLARMGLPVSVRGSFQGTAREFQASLATQPLLILAAIVTVYLVLGMLYESLLHPLTILSTLPSAGVGALLALLLCKTEFTVIALIGVVLLIGIVMKNAIMMIDFAIQRQRLGASAAAAMLRAGRLRLRPILMTSAAAIGAAIPLAIGQGDGAELRQPLGLAIVGGLLVSQWLTLYTTPVVYVGLDRLRRALQRRPRPAPVPTRLPA